MADLKVTIKQLRNYLGTGLKVVEGEYITRELIGLSNNQPILNDYGYSLMKNIQPICYRLSDLDKVIEVNGERFVPVIELAKLITQAGFDYKKIESISNENDTITCEFKQINHPDLPLTSHKHFFDIDIDKDFGFTIGAVIEHLGVTTEEYECTGNIWEMYQKLFEWHFWPFGDEYFDQGLILNKKEGTNA